VKTAVEIESSGMILRGILHQPDGVKNPPVAVMYHGFTGYKDEIHFMFSKTSEALEQAGIASLRFDFAGSGSSDGRFSDMTFSSELQDASAIFDYAGGLEWADTRRIFLLGMSMGGAIAGIIAARNRDRTAKLCLWAPAGMIRDVIVGLVRQRTGGFRYNDQDVIDFGAHAVSRRFFDDAETLDIYSASAGYTNPVRLFHGDADDIVDISNSRKYLSLYGDRAELTVVPGANHTFDSLPWESLVIGETVRFFREE